LAVTWGICGLLGFASPSGYTAASRAATVLPAGNRGRCGAFTPRCFNELGAKAVLGTILLVILILVLVGALPTWGYSRGWGYGPSGILGVIVVILLILVLMGRV
jgi:hypothetical protein